MIRNDISNTLNDIQQKHIEEAAAFFVRKKPKRWIKWIAVAACICLIISTIFVHFIQNNDKVSSPGFFTVTAIAAETGEETIMKEGITLSEQYKWNLAISSMPGLPLKLCLEDAPDANFEIKVEGGSILVNNDSDAWNFERDKTNCLVNNNSVVYWQNIDIEKKDYNIFDGEQAYINIIVKEKENIIGYAVVEVYLVDEASLSYSYKMLKSVSFPKINGKFQAISHEFITKEIAKTKA